METQADEREQRFDNALANFKAAGSELLAAWHAEGEEAGEDYLFVDNYPSYLPSFDEFVLHLQDLQRAQ